MNNQQKLIEEMVEATCKGAVRLASLAVDATVQRNPQILNNGIPDNFISDGVRERFTKLADAVREEERDRINSIVRHVANELDNDPSDGEQSTGAWILEQFGIDDITPPDTLKDDKKE